MCVEESSISALALVTSVMLVHSLPLTEYCQYPLAAGAAVTAIPVKFDESSLSLTRPLNILAMVLLAGLDASSKLSGSSAPALTSGASLTGVTVISIDATLELNGVVPPLLSALITILVEFSLKGPV